MRNTVPATACTYLHFDGMAWPNPADPAEIEWKLRYGVPSSTDLLVAASMVGAYKQLVSDPRRVRDAKVAGIRLAAGQGGGDSRV